MIFNFLISERTEIDEVFITETGDRSLRRDQANRGISGNISWFE